MARQQSTPGRRARSNERIKMPASRSAGGMADAGALPFSGITPPPRDDGRKSADSLGEVIEATRGRLSCAQSVLHCLHLALLSAEEKNRHEPGCADVADIAVRLVREAVHRLDSVYIGPLVERSQGTVARPGRAKQVVHRR